MIFTNANADAPNLAIANANVVGVDQNAFGPDAEDLFLNDGEFTVTVRHRRARRDHPPGRPLHGAAEPDQPGGRRTWPRSGAGGFAKGRELLREQSYEVLERVQEGDVIAARVTWRGTLAANGQELRAHIATFTQVRDGRIFRHATYDCYEAF